MGDSDNNVETKRPSDDDMFSNQYSFVDSDGLNYQQFYAYYLAQYALAKSYVERVNTLTMLINIGSPLTEIKAPAEKTGATYIRDFFEDEFEEEGIDITDPRVTLHRQDITYFRHRKYLESLWAAFCKTMTKLHEQGVITAKLMDNSRLIEAEEGGGFRIR